jgi:hypothetical protein
MNRPLLVPPRRGTGIWLHLQPVREHRESQAPAAFQVLFPLSGKLRTRSPVPRRVAQYPHPFRHCLSPRKHCRQRANHHLRRHRPLGHCESKGRRYSVLSSPTPLRLPRRATSTVRVILPTLHHDLSGLRKLISTPPSGRTPARSSVGIALPKSSKNQTGLCANRPPDHHRPKAITPAMTFRLCRPSAHHIVAAPPERRWPPQDRGPPLHLHIPRHTHLISSTIHLSHFPPSGRLHEPKRPLVPLRLQWPQHPVRAQRRRVISRHPRP